MEDGYYDPNHHSKRFTRSPPFPFAIIILAGLAVTCVIFYTNNDNLEHLINVFDAEYKELTPEEKKKHREWYKMIIAVCLILIALAIAWYLYNWRKEVKEAKLGV